MKKLNIEDKLFILILSIWFIILLFVIFLQGHGVDESTHSFVGLFLRDFIVDWSKHPTFSFSKIYNYAVNYMVFYPKISLHYPPVPQIFFATAYLFFYPSIIVSRGIVLLFSMGFIALIYLFVKDFFKNKKIALISAAIFLTSPIVVLHSTQALQEIPFIFFFTLTVFLFLKALKHEKNNKYYALAAISTVFCILSKWQAITIVPVILSYVILQERKKLKLVLLYLCLAGIILTPYYVILYKTNLLLLPLEANIPGPGSPKWYEIQGWLYYLRVLIFDQFFLPVGLVLLFSSFVYIKDKRLGWKLFLIWIVIIYVAMVFIENKNPKYTINMLPAVVIPSSYIIYNYLKKAGRKVLFVLLSGLLILQFLFALSSIPKGYSEVEEISKYVVVNSKGNILVNSALGTSSPFIFEIAKIDSFNHQILHPCLVNEANESFGELIERFNIEYIITERNYNLLSDRQREFLNYLDNSEEFVKEKEYSEFVVFRKSNFVLKGQEKICNYICATHELICSTFKKPSDSLK